MQRSRVLVHVLWSVAATASAAACGRLGFDSDREGGTTGLPDGPTQGTPVATFAGSASGQSTCGATDAPIAIAIANTGTGDLVITSGSASGAFAVTTLFPLTIAAGTTGSLVVTPPAAVIGTDVGGGTKTGALTFATNEAGAGSHTIALTSTVIGANVTLAGPVTAQLGFSGTSGACPPGQDMILVNRGNAPANVAVSGVSGFAYSGFSGGTLGSGESVATFVRPFTTATCAAEGSAVYTLDDTCTASTITVTLALNITGSSSCFCS